MSSIGAFQFSVMTGGETIDLPANILEDITRKGIPGGEFKLINFLGERTDIETLAFFASAELAQLQMASYKATQGGSLVTVTDDNGRSHTNIQVHKVTLLSTDAIVLHAGASGAFAQRVRWSMQNMNVS